MDEAHYANIIETRGEMKAIEMTLRRMSPGDLVLIQADQVEEAIAFVHQLLPKLAAEHFSVIEPLAYPGAAA